MTIAELAEKLNVSRQTLYTWEKLGCPIREGEGPALAWMAENKPEGSTPIHQQLLEAKLAKTRAEAVRVDLENRVSKGEVVNRVAVERFLTQFVNATRALIEDWPESIILEIPGEHRIVVFDLLQEQVRQLLNRLADMPAELFSDETIAKVPAPDSVSGT